VRANILLAQLYVRANILLACGKTLAWMLHSLQADVRIH
jgi:hypothetical protein